MAYAVKIQCYRCNYWCQVIGLPCSYLVDLSNQKSTEGLGFNLLTGELVSIICQKQKELIYVKMTEGARC